jgi:hypothetical protein
MKMDRHNRWFQAGMVFAALSVVVSAVELGMILHSGSVPPEWTNWLLMSMPALAVICFAVSMIRPRSAQTA